jgi:hypothetical protein
MIACVVGERRDPDVTKAQQTEGPQGPHGADRVADLVANRGPVGESRAIRASCSGAP